MLHKKWTGEEVLSFGRLIVHQAIRCFTLIFKTKGMMSCVHMQVCYSVGIWCCTDNQPTKPITVWRD